MTTSFWWLLGLFLMNIISLFFFKSVVNLIYGNLRIAKASALGGGGAVLEEGSGMKTGVPRGAADIMGNLPNVEGNISRT